MKQAPLLPKKIVPIESIEQRIFVIRGEKAILDTDLAQLYGVTTKRLNEQVKRNRDRFPEDFMFQLSLEEGKSILALRSQIATLKPGQHLKHAPYAFTEHGAVMVANVLNSPVAVHASIQVVRPLLSSARLLQPIKTLCRSWNKWKRNTINSLKWFSMQFGS